MRCAHDRPQAQAGRDEDFKRAFVPPDENAYDERRAAAEEFVESVGADGVFEIVDERSLD